MGTKIPATRHVLRQRSPLTLAVVGGTIGLLLLGSVAWNWTDNPDPLFLSWVLFGLALIWSLFVRPAVLLDDRGVTLRNVVRDVFIPWGRVTDVECRWNLKVFAGDRVYTAWAISSQVERPQGVSGGMLTMLPGRLEAFSSDDVKPSTPSPKVTAPMVARSIEHAVEDYADAVAQGAVAAAPDDHVRITWVPVVVAVLVLTAVAIVAFSLI